MAFLESLLVLHFFLPMIYCQGHYQLEVFVYNYEVPQLICDNELKLVNVTIVADAISSNISSGLAEPLEETCWNFFQIGFDSNLRRINPVMINYSSAEDMYLFAEVTFANESSMEFYTIAIDLRSLPLNADFSSRERYTHESDMFALHLSLRRTCSTSFTGEDCSIPVSDPLCEVTPTITDEITPSTFSDELVLPTPSDNPAPPTNEVIPPTSSDEMTLPTSLDELTLPTSSDELTLPISSDELTLPTSSDELTLSTSSDELAPPTTSDDLTRPNSLVDVILPTSIEEQIALSINPDASDIFTTNPSFLFNFDSQSSLMTSSFTSEEFPSISSLMVSDSLICTCQPVSQELSGTMLQTSTTTNQLMATGFPTISEQSILTTTNLAESSSHFAISTSDSQSVILVEPSTTLAVLSSISQVTSEDTIIPSTTAPLESTMTPAMTQATRSISSINLSTLQTSRLESLATPSMSPVQSILQTTQLISLASSASVVSPCNAMVPGVNVEPSQSLALPQGEPSQSSLTPMAVYLIASLGALVGLLLLIICAMTIAICCFKRYGPKEDFSPKWYNRYLVNPNDTTTDGADSLKGQARPRSQTHLTLINGQVFFWKSAKENRKKTPETIEEGVELADIPEEYPEETREIKTKSNVYEDHTTPGTAPSLLQEVKESCVSKKDEKSEEKLNGLPESQELELRKVDTSSEVIKASRPKSSIAAAENVTNESAEGLKKETLKENDRKSRLLSAEHSFDKENTGDMLMDIASLLPVMIKEPEKLEASGGSPTNTFSSNTNDNTLEYQYFNPSKSLIRKSPSLEQDSKNLIPVLIIPSGTTIDVLPKENKYSSKKSKLRKEKRLSTCSSTEDESLVVANFGAQLEQKHATDGKVSPDVIKDPKKENHEANTTTISSSDLSDKNKESAKPSGVKGLINRIESQDSSDNSDVTTPHSPNPRVTDDSKTLKMSNLSPTSVSPPVLRDKPQSPKLRMRPPSCPGVAEVAPKITASGHDSTNKKPTSAKHMSIDEGTMVKKFGEIFEEKSMSMEENPGSRREMSKRISSPGITEIGERTDKVSKDIKKRISSLEGKSPDSLIKPAGQSDVKHARVPKISIEGTAASPSVPHTKVSKKKSSDLQGELQKKLKKNSSPKVSLKEQKKSSSQDKTASAGKIPLLPNVLSQSLKEESSHSKSGKPDAKHSPASRKISTHEPRTGAKQEKSSETSKKPLMPPKKKVSRANSGSESQNIYASVKVKPKQKLDESIVVDGDGYVDPKDIAGRRVGPVTPDDSEGYHYVPVDAPSSHTGDANIDLMTNLAYAAPNINTAGDSDLLTNPDDGNDDDEYECVPNYNDTM